MNKNIKIIEDLGLIYANENSKKKHRYLIIECVDCKKHIRTEKRPVVSGSHSGRCGSCARTISSTKHGMHDTSIYAVWEAMKQRCLNPRSQKYDYYGGRGISICDEWLNFVGFYEWVKDSNYKEGLTIDRVDNDKGYSQSNCRWVSMFVQQQNTRKLHKSNTSGYRGVCYDKSRDKYTSNITHNGIVNKLGRFKNKLDAAKAYDKFIIDNDLAHTRNFS